MTEAANTPAGLYKSFLKRTQKYPGITEGVLDSMITQSQLMIQIREQELNVFLHKLNF